MTVKPIPDGFNTVTPYLAVTSVAKLIEFVQQAFGAVELGRNTAPDGRIRHAQVRIGDTRIMMGEPQSPWWPMPAALYIYVTDSDAVYARALAAGATSLVEPTDMDFGDRNGGVKDPCGNVWWIATRKQGVASE